MESIQFLYLIASGNHDHVFKVGISDDPRRRLEQIKKFYNVPNAYIVETMNVLTRDEALAMENAVHAKFSSKRSTRYGGREFFKLTSAELEWVLGLFSLRSNDFAQAKAYFGLVTTISDIADSARALEAERQRLVSFNRKNGKHYDARPKGVLKRYNDLKDKAKKGHLSERLIIKRYEHPSETLNKEVQQKAGQIIEGKVSKQWLMSAICGSIGGFVIGVLLESNQPVAYGISAFFFGTVSGGVSQASRESKEKMLARQRIESEIDARYPETRGMTMLAMWDLKTKKSFLISDFQESAASLREKPALLPVVSLPSEHTIYSSFEKKNYFPMTAVGATIGLTLIIGISQHDGSRSSINNSVQGSTGAWTSQIV